MSIRDRSVLVVLGLAVVTAAAAPGNGSPNENRPIPPGRAPETSTWSCPDWGMYGRQATRTFASPCDTAITPLTAPTLAPAWYVPTGASVTASPVVVEEQLFIGDWSSTMHALDADTGEVHWSTSTLPAPGAPFGPIVSSAAVADVSVRGEVRRLVIFGAGPRMYALDAEDGSEVWTRYFGAGVELEQTEFESSPVVHGGVVYVGMDVHNRTLEETGGVRGGVFALDAATGETRWYFNPEWDDERSGCSSVWSSPTLDLELGHVVAATGNCPQPYTSWTPYIEAVFALDMQTGEPVWSFQPHAPNRDDLDFGASPNLFTDGTGRRVLGIGSKDGRYYALDPASGELFWSTKVQEPFVADEDFSVGGFIGSTAVWDGNVYGATAIGGPPYYHALDGATGASRWSGVAGPGYGASAAANGVVFAAGLDDTIKAWEAETGVQLWTAPLSGPSSSGPALVDDTVYVGAGTSSSDLCAKDTPVFSDVCLALFDEALGGLGGVHAFRLTTSSLP